MDINVRITPKLIETEIGTALALQRGDECAVFHLYELELAAYRCIQDRKYSRVAYYQTLKGIYNRLKQNLDVSEELDEVTELLRTHSKTGITLTGW